MDGLESNQFDQDFIVRRWEERWPHGPGLVVSALDSGAIGQGSSPGRGYCVFGQDTLLSQCLSPPRCINGYRRIFRET